LLLWNCGLRLDLLTIVDPNGTYRLIGGGIYTVPEAARLTRVSSGRIRRWLKGYSYKVREGTHSSPPIVSGLPPIEGTLALGFLDLVEIRFVNAFLDAGVSWVALRVAHQRGRSLLHTDHPFASRRLSTDGRTIFGDVYDETHESAVLDLVKNQLRFRAFTMPYVKDLDFSADHALRWWPMGKRKAIVIDPQRTFGQPIVDAEGVPTSILYSAYRAERSFDKVSRWFEVERRFVRAAVEFEQAIAA
jgi:uncharacterized protein (DUF433 family)